MRFLNFHMLLVTICLIIGIILAYEFLPNNISIYKVTAIFLCCMFIFFIVRKFHIRHIIHTAFALLLVVAFGSILLLFSNSKYHQNYYTSKLKLHENAFTFKITEVLKPNNFYYKYTAIVTETNNQSTVGDIIINISKEEKLQFKPDDFVISSVTPKSIPSPKNPNQFNYKKYLEHQGIYAQLTLTKNAFYYKPSTARSIKRYAYDFRLFLIQKIDNLKLNDASNAILKALLLGYRDDISAENYTTFIDAGVVHILAVSGLHVGLLLIIISFFLKPLEQLKHGKVIKTVITIAILIGFAFVTGASPSVVRAVSMFCLYVMGKAISPRMHNINIAILSLFFLLIFKPLYIFNVGFQLSYAAVFSILLLEPIVSNIWKPNNQIIFYFWKILTVSFAAQIGVLPLSLYYFHQFPGLFLVSNVLVIPLIFLIIIIGIALLVLSFTTINFSPVSTVYQFLIYLLLNITKWVAHQETFLFREIHISISHMICSYLILICFIYAMNSKKTMALYSVLLSIIVLQATILIEKITPKNEQKFTIYQVYKHTLISRKDENHLLFYTDTISDNILRIITAEKVSNTIIDFEKLKNIYWYNNYKILLIDKDGIFNIPDFKPDFIILRNSPKINLETVLLKSNPKAIIADGSNYPALVNLWKKTCKKQKLPFHYTNEMGAYILELH
ncbi:ComEC/Rec2 family competence protein [Zhouia sp. PK063]|uniref:ComEC/Rec2 family competence protein n=1 Tax=Zhouia sp. PK063 TaxID=3373602 RepID=UPI00379DCD82